MVVEIKYLSNISIVYKNQLKDKIIFSFENFYNLPVRVNQFGNEKIGFKGLYSKDSQKLEEKSAIIFESFFFKLDSFDGITAFYSEIFLEKTSENNEQIKLW